MTIDLKNGSALSSPSDNAIVVGAAAAGSSAPGLWKFSDILSYVRAKVLATYLDFSEIASPANPAADSIRLFAKDVAGVTKLFTRDSAGVEAPIGAGSGGGGGGREVLAAHRYYYVRADGSDSNTGLVNSAGGAFATVQKAVDAVAALDISTYDAVVVTGPGSYTQPVVLKKIVGSGTVILRGDLTTPSNCILNTTAAQCITMAPGAMWNMGGFKLQTTTSGYCLDVSATGCELMLDGKMEYDAAGPYDIVISNGGALKVGAPYSILSGGSVHIFAQFGARLSYSPGAVTLVGTPAYSGAFILVLSGALVSTAGVTFIGSATGPRYNVKSNGVINTSGGGANYFPGNAVGIKATGGEYV